MFTFAADLFGIKDFIQFLGFFATIGAGIWYLARTIGRYETKIERLEERVSQLIASNEEMKTSLSAIRIETHQMDRRISILEDRQAPRFLDGA